MKRFLIWKKNIIGLTGFIFLGTTLYFCFFNTTGFPGDRLNKNVNALSRARSVDSELYSPAEFLQAEVFFYKALELFKKQNKKLSANRDYTEALITTEKSMLLAEKAIANSNAKQEYLQKEYRLKKDSTETVLSENREKLRYFPVDNPLNIHMIRTDILLRKGNEALLRGDLYDALNSVQMALTLADSINTRSEITDYYTFSNVDRWQQIVEDALCDSQNEESFLVVVEKLARKVRLYKTGNLIAEFDGEFSPNWIGPKQLQGDRKTPEGVYAVTEKRQDPHTKYYKALVIDYPNEQDINNFNNLLDKKLIAPGSKIGGLIEIHGSGGRGYNWTDGCVALANENMDIIYENSEVGTVVVIVGSLKTKAQIVKNVR